MTTPTGPSAKGEAAETDEPKVPVSGDLSRHSPETILKFCENVRFSGTIGFSGPHGRGVLPMLNGVPEIAAEDTKLEAALDAFLATDRGGYNLTQLLPALEGATAESDLALRGALGALSPSDLLRYCESAGLTGTLTFTREHESCEARYRRGELVSLTLDGASGDPIEQIFGWTDAGFHIVARSVFESRARDSIPEQQLLKTLELALTEIMSQGDRPAGAGAKPRTSAMRAPSILRGSTLPFGMDPGVPVAPRPSAAPRTIPARSIPPPPPEHVTVKVYLVGRAADSGPSSTTHAAAKGGTEVLQLDAESQRIPAVAPSAASEILVPVTVADDSEPATESPKDTAPGQPLPQASRSLAAGRPADRPVGGRASAISAAFVALFTVGLAASLYILVNLLR